MRKFYIPWTSTALPASTAKTIIALTVPANIEVELAELVVGLDVSTAGNLKIEFGTYTSGGTFTAATPSKYTSPGGPIDSAIITAGVSASAEPIGFAQGSYPGLLIPTPLYHVFQWPLEEGFSIPESVNFGIRLTSSVAGNTMGWLAWKE